MDHCDGGATPCEACLDWRQQQSEHMGAHFASGITAVVTALGIDVQDQDVRATIAAKIREHGAGIDL